jgi:hypothetical protein
MSAAVAPWAWTRATKFLGLLLLGLLVVLANAAFPLVRFRNELANVIVGAISLLLPFVAAVFVLMVPFPRRSLTAGIAIVLLLLLTLFCTFGLFVWSFPISETYRTGVNPEFQQIASVPMDRYSVNIYLTDCGTPCSFGIYILQEKQIFPGVLLVRKLYDFDPAREATYKVLGNNTIRVDVPAYDERNGAQSVIFRLKPYLYF